MSLFSEYQNYAESGFGHLGCIPQHWPVARFKFLFKRQSRPVSDTHGVVTAFRDGEVTLRSNRRSVGFTQALQEIGYQGVEPGDLVVHAMDGFAGAIGVSDSTGKCSPVYSVCTPEHEACVPSYYAALLRDLALHGFIESLAKGIRERSTEFRFSELKEVWLPVPPFEEQHAIANFLDHETARIDTLIEKQQRLIELLKEKRQAAISHAVTKGLDPNVPMKDSGVEWLGEVPEHWKVSPLKWKSVLQSGVAKGREIPPEESITVPYVRVANVQDGYLNLDHLAEISIRRGELPRYLLQDGDVLMNEGGDFDKLGRGAIWRAEVEPCIHQNHVFAIRPNKLEPEWVTTATQADYAKHYFILVSKQSTNLASISSSNLKSAPIVIPPQEERREILAYIEYWTLKIDGLIAKAETLRTLLQERRTALISAAVTGKIDVRNHPAAQGAA